MHHDDDCAVGDRPPDVDHVVVYVAPFLQVVLDLRGVAVHVLVVVVLAFAAIAGAPKRESHRFEKGMATISHNRRLR